jgi:hypothetical protein
MAKKYIFINKPLQTLQQLHQDKQYSETITFLPEKYVHGCRQKSVPGAMFECQILFSKKVSLLADLWVDIEAYSLNGDNADLKCLWSCKQLNVFHKSKTSQKLKIQDDDSLTLSFRIESLKEQQLMVSIRYFLDLGYNNSIHQAVSPFYFKTTKLPNNRLNMLIQVDERLYLPMLLKKTESSASPIPFPLNDVEDDVMDTSIPHDIFDFDDSLENLETEPLFQGMDL